MSGVITAVTVAGTLASIYSGQQQSSAAKRAAAQAEQNALKQEKSAEEAMNAQNRKRPDTAAMLDSAAQAGRAGDASTMLTGAGGAQVGASQLGRNTLLGM